MNRRKKTTDWPEGFEDYILGREFSDIEELLLWDCTCMCECFEEALARWKEREGWVEPSLMRSEEWKAVRVIADEISMDRCGAPLRMNAIRWGCRLAERLESRFKANGGGVRTATATTGLFHYRTSDQQENGKADRMTFKRRYA